jgi:hypothetical protein
MLIQYITLTKAGLQCLSDRKEQDQKWLDI